jgi:hypothetical protein
MAATIDSRGKYDTEYFTTALIVARTMQLSMQKPDDKVAGGGISDLDQHSTASTARINWQQIRRRRKVFQIVHQ